MTCFCGDNECPSCGLAQGTLVPSYNHGARVVIGRDPDGYEVALDFEIRTYGEVGDVRAQTNGEPYVGPYVRLCIIGSTWDPKFLGKSYAGQIQGVIRADLDRYLALFVSRKWLDRILKLWDRYHMNDMNVGTEAQIEFIHEVDKRWRKASYKFHCEILQKHGLYIDNGYEYGTQEFIRVIPEEVLDEILDLVEEGSAASNVCRFPPCQLKFLSGVPAEKMPEFRKAWGDMVKANEAEPHKTLVRPGAHVYSEPAQVDKSIAGCTGKLGQFAGGQSRKEGPMQPPKIEVGTAEMFNAFQAGIEYYRPTAGGHELPHPEAGATDYSRANLKHILELSPSTSRVTKVEVGPNWGVLFWFGPLECFLATGFAVGYGGTGPMGLARFLHEQGFGEREELREKIANLAQDFTGVLFERD